MTTRAMFHTTMRAFGIYETKWTREARNAYYQTHPQNFAGPFLSFPIEDVADVSHAAALIEQVEEVEDQDQIRAGIISIAKRLGFAHALPQAWRVDDSRADGSASVEHKAPHANGLLALAYRGSSPMRGKEVHD